ncbi:MAG: diaminopimelate decarboxylase [Bacteroidetes bacterium]|nr:diaminopimelate decarboxylase [Bacteroidota bacterium]
MNNIFNYKNNELFCEDLLLKTIAEKFGTPTYVYSINGMLDSLFIFENAFKILNKLVCYSVKANSNISVIKLFVGGGAGIDCNSGGELFRAIKAGATPSKIIFTGVGKTEEEIKFALETKVLMLKVESFQELESINNIAASLNLIAPIAIRVNPDVDAKTHPYISTGLAENKFGINISEAQNAFQIAKSLPNLKIVGVDMHIGSQITTPLPYKDAINKLILFVNDLNKNGIILEHLDVGGGFGVDYDGNNKINISEFANELTPLLNNFKGKIIFEPGRFLTANSGVLLTKVLFTKSNNKKEFVIVDAGMNDIVRPTLYNALHEIKPLKVNSNPKNVVDIVGPVCESADFIRKNYSIQNCNQGDYLAIMSSGAYGFVMSSNYNTRRRAAEVLVDKNNFYLIRKRETFQDLISGEIII